MAKILIVDDEQDIREILGFNLEAEGYETSSASSAEEALSMIEGGGGFDLILLDVMMDCMSGIEMAERLRRGGDEIPIVFLTARSTHDDQMECFSAGADDYIAKPFSFDTVLAHVRAVLRRCQQSAVNGQQSAVSGQQSAVSGRQLAVGGQQSAVGGQQSADEVGLTRREYSILRLLEGRPGHYFSREEILAAVWPDDTLVGERSVDVHIARLRKKLGSEGARIVNKTGFGYGLV